MGGKLALVLFFPALLVFAPLVARRVARRTPDSALLSAVEFLSVLVALEIGLLAVWGVIQPAKLSTSGVWVAWFLLRPNAFRLARRVTWGG